MDLHLHKIYFYHLKSFHLYLLDFILELILEFEGIIQN